MHRSFSRLPGLQALYPTTLCCTFTSVSITPGEGVGEEAALGTAARLPMFFTPHCSHLYTSLSTVSLTAALIFGFLTEAYLVV